MLGGYDMWGWGVGCLMLGDGCLMLGGYDMWGWGDGCLMLGVNDMWEWGDGGETYIIIMA